MLRQGRLTPGQAKALETLWPQYGLSIADGDPRLAFDRQAPLTLEIGFGMGDSLAQQASAQPGKNFLGIEVHQPGIGHLLLQIKKLGLDNLRLYRDDSLQVLSGAIADHSLSNIQVFFPDPWPKKRHHKRRLVNQAFAALAWQKLETAGVLHMATDWTPYADEIAALFASLPGFRPVAVPERPETKFERRGRRKGHEITDLAYASIDQQQ